MGFRWLAPMLTVVAGVALLAACGGDDPTPTTTTASSPTPTSPVLPTATPTSPTATPTTPPEPTPSPTPSPTAVPEPTATPTTAPSPTATATATPMPTSSASLTVTLLASKDTTIYNSSSERANGSGIGLFAGNTRIPSARRALLEFDIAGAVPAGATITSVSLSMRVTRIPPANPGPRATQLHRPLNSWGEGGSNAGSTGGTGVTPQTNDATWTKRFTGGESWSAPGGGFVVSASASATFSTGTPVWSSTAALVADVQAWVSDPSFNHGWLLKGDETGRSTVRAFSSREGSATLGPMLTIEYTPAG